MYVEEDWTQWSGIFVDLNRFKLVHSTPKEFQNRGFTLKTNHVFTVHTTIKEFKNARITGHFGFVFEENLVKGITSDYDAIVFEMISFHTKSKSRRFQIPTVWIAFSKKLYFRDGLVWTVRLIIKIKLRF